MPLIPDRLGPKLNLFLVGIFAVLGIATTALIVFGFERAQSDASQSSREGLEIEGKRTLRSLTTAQAAFGQAQLETTAGFAQQAARYFVDAADDGAISAMSADTLTSEAGITHDANPARRTDVLIPGDQPLTEAVLRDVAESSVLEQLFPTMLQGFQSETRSTDYDAIAIYYQTTNNVTRMYPPVEDLTRFEDLTGEALLQSTLTVGPEQNPERRTIWTSPYEDSSGRGLVITALVPVYRGDEFTGAMGVDLSLARLVGQVDMVRPTTSGYGFYIDRNGKLLPTAAASDIQAEIEDPRNTEFAAIIGAMQEGRTDVLPAEVAGREMFVAFTPLGGVGGNFALVAPVDEVTQQAAAVERSVNEGGRNTLLIALGGMAAILALTLSAAAWLSRRLVLLPVAELVSGTRALAAGDLEQEIPVRSGDELGTLAASFNGMTSVLRERTQDLLEREEQYRSVFESSHDGIIITQIETGTIVEVNEAMCTMHGYTREEFMHLQPPDFIHPDDHHLFVDYLATVSGGGDYRCRARDVRKDGSLVPVEVLGTPVTYNGLRHVLGVVRDITGQVEAERILERRVEERTGELAALLKVSQGVAAALDLKSVARAILHELAEAADYSGATLAVVEGDDLVIIDSWGPFREEVVDGPTARFPKRVIPVAFWQAMENAEPVVVDDVRDDSLLARSYRGVFRPFLDLPSFASIRSWIAVPLVRQGQIVGMLTASHDKVNHFKEENTRVVLGAASQAAVAIENARLFEETQEQTRELQTLLGVSHNVASTIELGPLIDLILEQVREVADFERASVLMLDEEKQALRVINTLRWEGSPAGVGAQLGTLFPVEESPEFWAEFNEGRAVLIDDVRGNSLFAQVYRRAAAPRTDPTLESACSWMGVPLMSKERVLGIITLTTRARSAYSQRQAKLLTAIASQAAVAIDNARLFEQTEERTRELATLLDVSKNVASTVELKPLLNLILEQVSVVAPSYRSSFMVLDGDDLEVVALQGTGVLESEYVNSQLGLRFPAVGSPFWERIRTGQPLIIDDVHGPSPDAAGYRAAIGDDIDRSFAAMHGWMAIPVMLKDRPIGMLILGSEQIGFYTAQHARLARAVADQAAVVIENAQLFEQTEERNRESAALLQISNSLTSTLELDSLVRVILAQLGTVVDYTGSSVIVLNKQNELEILASRVLNPPNAPDLRGMRFAMSRTSSVWQQLERLETVIIDDIEGESQQAREYRGTVGRRTLQSASFSKIRSWMGVPLAAHNRVIGMLSLSRTEPGFFTEAHARIAAAVGQQAAVAIENARLYEQAEERTQELGTLLDVSRNVASTLELQPLLQLILEQLRRVAPYDGATFFILHGDRLRAEAYVTREDPDVDTSTLGMEIPYAGSLIWERTLEGETSLIDNIYDDTPLAVDYRKLAGPALRTRFKRVRSWLGLPLMRGGQPIGVLALSGHTTHVFNADHARLARGVADRAVLAIENARLYEEISLRARETEALLRADAELFRSLSLDEVFQALCDVAVDVMEADKCMVTTLEDPGKLYTVRASRGISADSIARMMEIRRAKPDAGTGVITEPLIHEDVRGDVPDMRDVFDAEGIISTIDVPVRIGSVVHGDFGVIYTRRHLPSKEELRLFQALADRASLAIQNAELYERSQQVASLEERQRLARELHDSVSQALYGIALGARTARTQLDRDPSKAVEPVEYVLQLAEAGLAEMRALILELRPESLQTEGLVAAIEKQVASTRARYSLDVTAELGAEPNVRIEVKEALYRVTQEALHNIVKHAQAQHVNVTLNGADGEISLEVRDDGRGFDASATYPGHVGLHSMRERIEKLRGEIAIESVPGKGSSVRVRVPIGS